MPLTFFPSRKMSFTHLIPACLPLSSVTAWQAARAARVVSLEASAGLL